MKDDNKEVKQAMANIDEKKAQLAGRYSSKVAQPRTALAGKTMSLNIDNIDVVFDSLPPQLQLIIDHTCNEGGEIAVDELNEWFINEFNYKQDAVTVIGHYLTRFNKAYKGHSSDALNLFNFVS